MTQTPNTPAGWYPEGGQERWWDGNAWSDNYRPLGSAQAAQPAQPVAPGYQPAYGQPQPYVAPPTQPAQKSHLARNLLIAFGVLFLLFVGGCVAIVAVVGNKANDVINDDTVGGPNNPLTITEGQAFEVNGFEYGEGWDIADAPASGLLEIENLKVTNHRGKADRLFTTISLLNGSEVVATTTCTAQDGEKIPKDTTVTVDCSSGDPLPAAYDKITINDVI
jgi:hypothetical protein